LLGPFAALALRPSFAPLLLGPSLTLRLRRPSLALLIRWLSALWDLGPSFALLIRWPPLSLRRPSFTRRILRLPALRVLRPHFTLLLRWPSFLRAIRRWPSLPLLSRGPLLILPLRPLSLRGPELRPFLLGSERGPSLLRALCAYLLLLGQRRNLGCRLLEASLQLVCDEVVRERVSLCRD